jgi:hypothetical protein
MQLDAPTASERPTVKALETQRSIGTVSTHETT